MSEVTQQDTENQDKDKIITALCKKGHPSNHEIIYSFNRTWSEIDREERWGMDGSDDYQVIKCRCCEAISFRQVSYFSEDRDPWPGGSNGVTTTLYPDREEWKLPEKAFKYVPPTIERIYSETIASYNYKSFVLCAIGLRALLESICNNLNITKGPVTDKKTGKTTISKRLDGKLNGLAESKKINPSHLTTLHQFRFIGNDAAHELIAPPAKDLRKAFEIIEHILSDIYDIPILGQDIHVEDYTP